MTPNILVLDIETAPGSAYIWSMFDDYVPLDRVISPPRIICWGAKWVGKRAVYQADERAGREVMLRKVHALMSEADAIVTYNGDKFDFPKLNGEFVMAGLPPLPPITSIDLYKTVRKLGFLSSKLEFVGPLLRIGAKMKHAGFSLWRRVMEGDSKAWAKMRRYNAQDVRMTDALYAKLRPYIPSHPYLGAVIPSLRGKHECPRCGSEKHQLRGTRRTKTQVVTRIQCLGCGGWYTGQRRKVA